VEFPAFSAGVLTIDTSGVVAGSPGTWSLQQSGNNLDSFTPLPPCPSRRPMRILGAAALAATSFSAGGFAFSLNPRANGAGDEGGVVSGHLSRSRWR